MPAPPFPFTPKSTAYVRPGDFWGTHCVVAGGTPVGESYAWAPRASTSPSACSTGVSPLRRPRTTSPGARVLDHGRAHIKTIGLTGGALLGHRPLEADGGWSVLVWVPDDGRAWNEPSWGYLEIEGRAHEYFGRHFPEHPDPASERPAPLQREERDF